MSLDEVLEEFLSLDIYFYTLEIKENVSFD